MATGEARPGGRSSGRIDRSEGDDRADDEVDFLPRRSARYRMMAAGAV
jgi:hypothetical protein